MLKTKVRVPNMNARVSSPRQGRGGESFACDLPDIGHRMPWPLPSASPSLPSHSAAFASALPATAADDKDPAGSSDLKRYFSRMAGESRIMGHSELPMRPARATRHVRHDPFAPSPFWISSDLEHADPDLTKQSVQVQVQVQRC